MDDFILAFQSNDLEKVKSLIDNGINIHHNNEYALMCASEKGYFEIVKLLIEKGANIKVWQNNPLRWASHNGHLEVVKLLVAKGADVQDYNNCAVEWACQYNHLEVAKFLFANGANIHDDNNYAIKWACYQGSFDTVKFLIENGVNIHVDDDKCLLNASKNGHIKVVELLLEKCSYPAISDKIIKQAHENVKSILMKYKYNMKINLYYGIVSDNKLDIKLPNLQEINKDSKYYYVYQYTQDDNGYILDNEDKIKKMLSSLNISIVRTFVNL